MKIQILQEIEIDDEGNVKIKNLGIKNDKTQSVITKKLTNSEEKYGIILMGKKAHEKLCIPKDQKIHVVIDGVKTYEAKTHSDTKGRVDGLRKAYKDRALADGMHVCFRYDAQAFTLYIDKVEPDNVNIIDDTIQFSGPLNMNLLNAYSDVKNYLDSHNIDFTALFNTNQTNNNRTLSVYIYVKKNGKVIHAGTDKGYPMITIGCDGLIIIRSLDKKNEELYFSTKFEDLFNEAYASFEIIK